MEAIERGEVKWLRVIEETSRVSATPGGALNQTFLVGVEDTSTNKALVISRLPRGHWLVRALGVLWLVVGAGFVIAGIGLLQDAEWAVEALVAATAASTVLSLMWVREAPFGLVANALIIAVLVLPWLNDKVLP